MTVSRENAPAPVEVPLEEALKDARWSLDYLTTLRDEPRAAIYRRIVAELEDAAAREHRIAELEEQAAFQERLANSAFARAEQYLELSKVCDRMREESERRLEGQLRACQERAELAEAAVLDRDLRIENLRRVLRG